MSKALFKATFKANYKLFLIILMIMIMYSSIIISMYDPNAMDGWEAIFEMMPRELLNAMGFEILEPTFLGYIAGYYYGFIIIIFPMIYIIIMGQRAIAKHVDQGSMSFLLATPNSRQKIAVTQAIYLILSLMILIMMIALSILAIGVIAYPGELEMFKFFMLNLNVTGLLFLISGIAFLASAVFNEVRTAVGVGSGFAIGFFVVNMLAQAHEDLSFFRFFTIFTLFDSDSILALDGIIYLQSFVLYATGILLYLLGIRYFMKKDLHI